MTNSQTTSAWLDDISGMTVRNAALMGTKEPYVAVQVIEGLWLYLTPKACRQFIETLQEVPWPAVK